PATTPTLARLLAARRRHDAAQDIKALASTTLAVLRGAGFPNQFFCDSWVVGFWRGRPWLAARRAPGGAQSEPPRSRHRSLPRRRSRAAIAGRSGGSYP